jgi:hypothetical protein
VTPEPTPKRTLVATPEARPEATPKAPPKARAVAAAAKPRRAPKPPPPIVRVDIEAPEGAIIEIEGKRLGIAPVKQYPVPEGRHRVRARLADGTVMQRTVEISPDRSRIVFY